MDTKFSKTTSISAAIYGIVAMMVLIPSTRLLWQTGNLYFQVISILAGALIVLKLVFTLWSINEVFKSDDEDEPDLPF